MEILLILFLILLNAFFALSEIVFIGSKRVKIIDSLKRGNNNAKIVLKYMKEPEKYLSSIQVGITLIGIVSGTVGGVVLADDFTIFLEQFFYLGGYANEVSIVIIIGLITYFSIVIGELLPKAIGLRQPERIMLFIIPVINIFTKIFYPIVFLLSVSTKILLKMCNLRIEGEKTENPIREIVLLTKLAVNNNKLSEDQAEMLFNSININKLSLDEIMTKKEDVDFLTTTMSMEDIITHTQKNRHTRYPLLENGDIVGYIHLKDLYYASKNDKLSIKDITRKILFFKDTEKVITILPQLLKRSQHIAIVRDVDDQIVGMITLENILESIVGEINDEYDMQ